MMGWQTGDQRQLFYLFNLERRIPASHLLRRINPIVMQVLADLREKLAPFYSDIGRPSIDPELMIRMLIVGYCYGIRFERRLCEEVELHLAYRWFCRLDLKREPRRIPRGGVSGTLMWAIRRAKLRGLRFANSRAHQKFLTERPARTAHRASAPGSASAPLSRSAVSR